MAAWRGHLQHEVDGAEDAEWNLFLPCVGLFGISRTVFFCTPAQYRPVLATPSLPHIPSGGWTGGLGGSSAGSTPAHSSRVRRASQNTSHEGPTSPEEEESSRPKGPTHTERLAKLTRTRSQSAPPVYRGPSRREVTGQAGVPKDPPLPLDVPLRQGRASARPMSSRRRRREARRRRPACI